MLIWIYRAVGVLCLLKTIDFATRLPSVWPTATVAVFLALWTVASIAMLGERSRRGGGLGLAVLATTSMVGSGFQVHNQHVYLIGAIGAIAVLFSTDEQILALRAQVSIVYLFAAVTKINGYFLSGAVLYRHLGSRPMNDVLAIPEAAMPVLALAAIGIELGLAVALWFRRTRLPAVVVGVGFHVAMIVFMSSSPIGALRLVVFGGLLLALYPAFFVTRLEPAAPTDTPARSPDALGGTLTPT